MKQKVLKIIAAFMIVVCMCGTYVASTPKVEAKTASEIQAEIDKLEKESAELQAQINKLKNDIKNQQKTYKNL